MSDLLETYNQIADAADRALQRTTALIKDSQALSKVKAGAGLAFHGMMGPGTMLYDPFFGGGALNKVVSGEAGLAKASKDFVIDAKQFEIGGKLAANSIETLGKTTFANSKRVVEGTEKVGKVFRDFTNTSKMMNDSIKALAGRTGLLATSFKGLAQTIKVATGPIGTALMVATVAYDQFVKKWMDNSAKLEESVETLSGLFSDMGTVSGTKVGMNRWAAKGGSRQEFLSLLDENFNEQVKLKQREAMNMVMLAGAMSRQSGTAIDPQYNKLMEHFSVRALQGATPEEIKKERLRMRVEAGGPNADASFKGPLQRYREWSEDIGSRLNNAARGWSPSEIYKKAASEGTLWRDLKESAIGHLNREMGVGIAKLPVAPGINIEDIGNWFKETADVAETSSANWNINVGKNKIRLAEAKPRDINKVIQFRQQGILGQAGKDLSNEERIMTGFKGRLQVLEGLDQKLTRDMRKEEEALIEKESQLELNQQYLAAYESKEKLRKRYPKAAKELDSIIAKIESAKTGEQYDEATIAALEFGKASNISIEDIVNSTRAAKNYGGNIPKTRKEAQQLKKTIEAANARIEEDYSKLGKAQELRESIGAINIDDPSRSLKKVSDLSNAALRTQILSDQEDEQLLLSDIEYLRNAGTKVAKHPSGRKLIFSDLNKQFDRLQARKLGLTNKQYAELKEARAKGDAEAEAKILKGAEIPLSARQRAELQKRSEKIDLKEIKNEAEILQRTLPTRIESLRARGILTEEQQKEIEKLKDKEKGYDFLDEQAARQILKKATVEHESDLQKINSKSLGIQREGASESLRLTMATQARKGMGGAESGLMQGILGSGNVRLIDASQSTMRQILSIRESMYRQEIDFTLKYAQSRMQIIQTHYDNLNLLEKGRLTKLDNQYGPHIQYGQAMYGIQGTMNQAQMGRYAGADWSRQQFRGARGLQEQYQEIIMGAAGYQMPQEMQIARSLRGAREAREDFLRSERRQKEQDALDIGGARGTQGALLKQLGGPEELRKFYQSEGGRQLLMQMLQQTQGAFSRQGIDVSGKIQGLAREQQAFEGKKLATSLRMRQRDTASMEEQTAALEGEVGRLPGKSREAQEVKMALAEQYKRLSNQYLSTGQIDKAEQASKKQEELLKGIPAEMKRDFGDAVKQQLSELKMHTEILKAIKSVLTKGTPEKKEEPKKAGAVEQAIGQGAPEKKEEPKKAGATGTAIGAGSPGAASQPATQKQRPHQLPSLEGEVDKRKLSTDATSLQRRIDAASIRPGKAISPHTLMPRYEYSTEFGEEPKVGWDVPKYKSRGRVLSPATEKKVTRLIKEGTPESLAQAKRILDAREIPLSEIDHRAPTGTGNLYTTDLAKREGRELTRDEKVKQGFLASSLQRSRFIGGAEHKFPYMPGRHPFDKDSWRHQGGPAFNIAPRTPGSEGYVNRSALGDVRVQTSGPEFDVAQRLTDKAFKRELKFAEKQPSKEHVEDIRKKLDERYRKQKERASSRGRMQKVPLGEDMRGEKIASYGRITGGTPEERQQQYEAQLAARRGVTLRGLSNRAAKIEDENPQLAQRAKESLYEKINAQHLRGDYTKALEGEGWQREAVEFTRPDKSTYESNIFRRGAQTMTMDQDQLDRAAMEWRKTSSLDREDEDAQKEIDRRSSVDKFSDGADKISRFGEKLEKMSVDVQIHGAQGSATVSGGEAGTYGGY